MHAVDDKDVDEKLGPWITRSLAHRTDQEVSADQKLPGVRC
jgi:hypothetical protein